LLGSNGNKSDNLASAVTEVSERVTVLIREEIELAKAEVGVKIKSLTKGIVWFGIAAGLGFFGVIFIPVTIAWLLDDFLVSGAGGLWEGFAIVMAAFFAGAGACVYLGIRKMKVGSPAPKMAIEEAKKIRATVTAKSDSESPIAKPPAVVVTAKPVDTVAAEKPAAVVATATTVGEAVVVTEEPEGEAAPDAVKPEGEAAPDAVKPEGEAAPDAEKPEGEAAPDAEKPEGETAAPAKPFS
jgi:hypothetical protein